MNVYMTDVQTKYDLECMGVAFDILFFKRVAYIPGSLQHSVYIVYVCCTQITIHSFHSLGNLLGTRIMHDTNSYTTSLLTVS